MLCFGQNSFPYLCKLFFSSLLNHYRVLFLDFDPVYDANKFGITKNELLTRQKSDFKNKQQSTINLPYIFPTLTMLYITVESHVIYFQAHYTKSPHFLSNLFEHRIYPKAFWAQSDVILEIGKIMAVTIYTCLLFDKKLDPKFNMFIFVNSKNNSFEIVQNGRVLSPEVSKKIAQYQKPMTHYINILSGTVFLVLSLFCSSTFLTFWTGSFRDYLVLLELIGFLMYIPISNLYMIFYFMMVVRYIRIKQNINHKKIKNLKTMVSSKNTHHQKR